MELKELALRYLDLGGRLVQLLNLPKLTDDQKNDVASVDKEMQKVSAEMWRVRCTN